MFQKRQAIIDNGSDSLLFINTKAIYYNI